MSSIISSAQSAARPLMLEAARLPAATRTRIGIAMTILGVAVLILGLALIIWPAHTLVVLTAVVGINFILIGSFRVGLGIFSVGTDASHRVLSIVLGLLLVAAGIIAVRNLGIATASLLVLITVVLGIGWIIDGVVSLVESQGADQPGWAIAYGIISIIAGIIVVSIPVWSSIYLVLFAGIALIVLGVLAVIRAIQFIRRSAAEDVTPV